MTWPFDQWLQIAVRRFGLSPNEFWEMPLREWLSLMQATHLHGFDRAVMADLMKDFPDRGDENGPD